MKPGNLLGCVINILKAFYVVVKCCGLLLLSG